ncbi:MAG: neutral/alkaline non-lysosomal ceramidase N-terminal domain-containing protein [Limnochordia bacterium]
MKAGFGESIITPPLGLELSGYFNERIADGVLDDLRSRALVVSDDESTVAIVIADVLCIPYADVLAVREEVAKRTGIPGEHVLVAATHTHTGPVTNLQYGRTLDKAYMQMWHRQTASAVETAYLNMQDARLSVGRGALPHVAFNRRFRMKNGKVHTNPGIMNPEIDTVAGPVDPTVTVARFDDLHGQPIGVLTHFGCHPDTTGGNKYSADWFGVAAKYIQLVLGEMLEASAQPPGVVVLCGPAGNINHINVHDPQRKRRWPRPTLEIGVGLAMETIRVFTNLGHPVDDADVEVDAARKMVSLECMSPTEFIELSRQALADPKTGSMERRRAESNLAAYDPQAPYDESIAAEVQCLRIGPLLVAGAPGEYFCEFGIAFKEALPNMTAITVNLANGALGYIPTESAYREGGYEPRTTRLVLGSGEAILDAQIELAKALCGDWS